MKSITIAFRATKMMIPIGYHHQVQSLIYNLLRKGGREELHDKGLCFGSRGYKLFTFSSLRGGKVIREQKKLYFENRAFLDIRSVDPDFCDSLLSGLQSKEQINLCGFHLSVESVKINDIPIVKSTVNIKMLSPLSVHKTDENSHTEYMSPLDAAFADEINANFVRKYYAFYGKNPISKIVIKTKSVGMRDKYITLYKKAEKPNQKDIYITGWRGEYELSGLPEYLNFLYYCGLGARNSDGFGMFEII